jgi:hypothetical protein
VTINEALVGKRYPPHALVLEPDRVLAFARAVGQRVDGVPPTVVTAPELAAGLTNVVADPELGLDLSKVLHGEQEYEWKRPLAVGETITAEASIESIRSKGSLAFLTLRTEIRAADAEVVALGRSVLVVREAP